MSFSISPLRIPLLLPPKESLYIVVPPMVFLREPEESDIDLIIQHGNIDRQYAIYLFYLNNSDISHATVVAALLNLNQN